MNRPSEAILDWFRAVMQRSGMRVAELAQRTQCPRQEVRAVLSGRSPLTVDQFSTWSQALELTEQDIQELVALQQAPSPSKQTRRREPAPPEDGPSFDPFGIQGEQAVRLAFALGVDFALVSDVSQLGDSGVPSSVLDQWRDRSFLLRLDAAFHRYNEPQYSPSGLTLTLSFDALYTCTFPWSAIQQVLFFLEPPPPSAEDPEEEPRPMGSHLRLVT